MGSGFVSDVFITKQQEGVLREHCLQRGSGPITPRRRLSGVPEQRGEAVQAATDGGHAGLGALGKPPWDTEGHTFRGEKPEVAWEPDGAARGLMGPR